MELISAGGCLVVFLALYALLHQRANRAGRQPRIQSAWLAAIIGCAALALLIGVLAH